MWSEHNGKKKLSCCHCQESNTLPCSSTPQLSIYRLSYLAYQTVIIMTVNYVHKHSPNNNLNCHRPWGSSTSIFSSVYQPAAQTVTLPAAVHLKHTASVDWGPYTIYQLFTIPTSVQVFNTSKRVKYLKHSYMFRHNNVILREYVVALLKLLYTLMFMLCYHCVKVA